MAIYRLFAYVVSDEKDYPNNIVFTKNKANMEKLKKGDEVNESFELVLVV